ncbi:MAG TPA: glycosyltransferase family 39 protein [Candidatus Binatia bacterium]
MPDRLGLRRSVATDIFLLLAMCFALYYWHLGLLPFYTRGESREALVVWEMVRTGDWILPRVNGDYIPFKPPLFHWTGAILATLTHRVDEFTVRLPSAIFATCGVLMIYFAGARLWNKNAGLVSAVVLATTTEWWNSATIAQVDLILAFFVTAGLLYFYRTYRQGRASVANAAILGVLLACATLAKGPVGIAVPGFVIFVFLLLRRDLRFFKPGHLAAAATVFILIAGSWYFAAWRQGGSGFLQRQILEENFGTASGVSGHYQPSIYYFAVYVLNFLPWSFFTPAIAWFLFRYRRSLSDRHLLFPVVWFVSVLVFFTISQGKRGVYILPLYPAAALLLGAWVAELETKRQPGQFLATATTYVIAITAGLAALTALMTFLGPLKTRITPFLRLAAYLRPLAPIAPSSWVAIGIFGLSALVVCVFLTHKRWQPVFLALGVLTAASAVFVETAYYPVFAAQRTLKPFMERVTQRVGPDAPLFFYDLFDFGAVFYSRRHIPIYDRAEPVKRVYLLMREEDWKRLNAVRSLERLDISEGGGPTGRHKVVLAERYVTSSEKSLPVSTGGPSDAELRAD